MSKPFGTLSEKDQEQFLREDEERAKTAVLCALRAALGRFFSTAPNVYRRHARTMGAACGAARAICTVAAGGKTVEGALNEVDAIKDRFGTECDRIKAEITQRRRKGDAPEPFNPNTPMEPNT